MATPPETLRDPRSFNRFCRWAALLWLALTVPAGLHYRPTFSDFAQFYMGGLLTRLGESASLYPIPTSPHENPGLRPDSLAKPRDRELRAQLGVPDDTRFMLPPPSALVFVPLSFFSYKHAGWIWTAIMIACTWGVALYAARFHRKLAGGRESHVEGLVIALIVVSPAVLRAIRIGNTTPAMAVLIASALHQAMKGDRFRVALAIFAGALLKYAALVLVPVLVAMRRWRALFAVAALGLAVTLIALAVMGPAPFREFAAEIGPTLDRPSRFKGNQSLAGLLVRAYLPQRPLPAHAAIPLAVARLATLALLLFLIFRQPRAAWRNPVLVLAASAALLCWLFVFSPIAWEHWPILLCPFWGWLAWEAARARWPLRVVVAASVVMMSTPLSIIPVMGFMTHPNVSLPEVVNSIQLWGVLLMFALATLRLASPTPATADDPHGDAHTPPGLVDSPTLQSQPA